MQKEEIYKKFEELDKVAALGGGVVRIDKQHEAGRMTARERIDMLLDKGTFVELDKFVTHRCTNFGMEKNKIPGDGVVSGYGKIEGRQVFVYAYDFTAYGGTLSSTNAAKIVKVQTLALKNGAPVIALNDSGGRVSRKESVAWQVMRRSSIKIRWPPGWFPRFRLSSVLVPVELVTRRH